MTGNEKFNVCDLGISKECIQLVLWIWIHCKLLVLFSGKWTINGFLFRVSHIVSFVWCFGYIVFFRTTHYLGLPKVPSHSNAVQLLLTLKVGFFHGRIHFFNGGRRAVIICLVPRIKVRTNIVSLQVCCYEHCFSCLVLPLKSTIATWISELLKRIMRTRKLSYKWSTRMWTRPSLTWCCTAIVMLVF